MKDSTRAWIVFALITLGSAECSDPQAAIFVPPPTISGDHDRDYERWQQYQAILEQQRQMRELQEQQDRYERQQESEDYMRNLMDAVPDNLCDNGSCR